MEKTRGNYSHKPRPKRVIQIDGVDEKPVTVETFTEGPDGKPRVVYVTYIKTTRRTRYKVLTQGQAAG